MKMSSLTAFVLAALLVTTSYCPLALGASWTELTGEKSAPSVIAISRQKTGPESLPFIPERMVKAGLWVSFTDKGNIGKIAETTKESQDDDWEETEWFVHFRGSDGKWISRPLCESAARKAAAVSIGAKHYALHKGFWSNIQKSRPKSADEPVVGKHVGKTGSFTANLSQLDGDACTPDDRKKNPFINFKGDLSKETASVVVPAGYDGSKPFGLMVFLSPSHIPGNALPGQWAKELAARNYIWIGSHNTGNNHPGDRRVWMAQQCRAWALHHYKIDPAKIVISGSSNGADAASATLVSTPFGFSSALLHAPLCHAPLGPVGVPREAPRGQILIPPLSAAGISHIKKSVRVAYTCGTKDQLSYQNCKGASEFLASKLVQGCKLFELVGVGHSGLASIAESLDYLDGPRGQNESLGGRSAQSPAVLRNIEASLSNPGLAKKKLADVWKIRPDLRSSEQMSKLLEKLERLP